MTIHISRGAIASGASGAMAPLPIQQVFYESVWGKKLIKHVLKLAIGARIPVPNTFVRHQLWQRHHFVHEVALLH